MFWSGYVYTEWKKVLDVYVLKIDFNIHDIVSELVPCAMRLQTEVTRLIPASSALLQTHDLNSQPHKHIAQYLHDLFFIQTAKKLGYQTRLEQRRSLGKPLVKMASFQNIYTHRKVADTASKACEICYKPSTSVLVAPDNKVGRLSISLMQY